MTLAIEGKPIVSKTGGHPTGDPLLPAVAMTNYLRTREGVRAGQMMSTGSYTGLNFAKPGKAITAAFEGFGSARVLFLN